MLRLTQSVFFLVFLSPLLLSRCLSFSLVIERADCEAGLRVCDLEAASGVLHSLLWMYRTLIIYDDALRLFSELVPEEFNAPF
jgi:hypothetical protein